MTTASISFDDAFEKLTGNSPFPWQEALYERFVSDRPDNIPSSCNIPTGLGKTSVVAIWLIALMNHPERVPRRLVYVVNRRTVVDQTTAEVEKLRENLAKVNPIACPLAVSTLRGQFADNREWSADPSRPAVICGTVDMIGSRLLFSGYGVGFKTRPLHAGFLGQDTLIVHDEAHLEPAFQELLLALQKEQREGRFPDRHPLQVMELSATSRGQGEVFELTPADKADDVAKQRIHAKKTMVFHSIADEKNELADKLVELSLAHKDSQHAILIFVRTVDDLGKVVAKLPKDQNRQLTGTMRGLEREALIRDPLFVRFLPESSRPENTTAADGTVYLVCTSAGEVGVNISADHLVCDLTPFDSMAQRFGRVNRFGLRDDTRIDIVHPAEFEQDKKLDQRREKTLALLKTLNGNGSPAALGGLNLEKRLAAFSPQPAILPVTDILLDAWALTTIHEKLPGRPPVAEYLHGVSDWEPPQTRVAWRTEVAEITGELLEQYKPVELLDDYPLKIHELLTDRSDRVFNTLKKLSAVPETPVWRIDDEGEVTVATLDKLANGGKTFIENSTLLLPPQAGGLENGFLNYAANYDPQQTDYDVADKWEDRDGPFRARRWINAGEVDISKPAGMKLLRVIVFPNPDDEDADPIKMWCWFVRPSVAEADTKGVREYALQSHLEDAKSAAEKFVSSLSLDPDLREVVIFAATYHDLGKDRERWQRGIGNTDFPAQKWAKSGKRRAATERSPYRHEFGSLFDVRVQPAFAKLSPDSKELVLHLIAAHHGRARPHFPAGEAFDDNHPGDEARILAIEVPQRFARLQRKFGRWGLAYLESLVRAADISASRKAEGRGP
jgi:CRISPR-associated endonuclease/helicase Cas3